MSLDGYFVDVNGGISWAKLDHKDAEWIAFVAENASGEGPLLFGRVTYELMASYWPTPVADQHDPDKDADVREWECGVVLRADGVKEEHNDRATST